MRVNVQNMLRQAGNAIPARNDSGGYRFALTQLAEHLLQLRDRTQAGDQAALDEFFRLYVFDDGKSYRTTQAGQTEQYLVLCRAHCDGYALWWRPNRCGYTNNLDWAGRYSLEEAEKIVRGSDRGEEMWSLSLVEQYANPRRMIDLGDSANALFESKCNRDWLRATDSKPAEPVASSPTATDFGGGIAE